MLRSVLATAVLATSACGRLGFHDAPPPDPAADAAGAVDAAQVAPIHRYRLDDSYADDLGGPALSPRGGALVPGGYRFAENQGLTLTGALPAEVYTVDLVFSFDVLGDGSWRKILDFKDLGSDNGLYTYGAMLQFVVVAGTTFANAPPGLTAQTTMRVTLARDAKGATLGYVNRDAAMSFRFVDTAEVSALDSKAVAHFFVDDMQTSGEASGGTVRRITIYDVALGPAELPP